MILPVLPSYGQSLGLNEASIGLIVAVPSFARAVLNLPMGRIVDVVGRRWPMIIGGCIDGIGCMMTAAAGGLHSMVAARLVMGSGSAIATSASEAYMMDVVAKHPKHKGTFRLSVLCERTTQTM